MRGDRGRNKGGELRKKRGATHAGIIEDKYNVNLNSRSDKQLNTLLKERGKNSWEVFLHGGRTSTGKDAVEWAREAEARGAGEILLTSMDGDGTQAGYDIAL